MKTEEQIIYTILNTVRSGEFNLDEPLTERLLRNFLKTHRASRLNTYYEQGNTINDVCFQELSNLTFEKTGNVWKSTTLPKIVPFTNNSGVHFSKQDYTINVKGSEQWRLNQKDRYNKYQPAIKLVNNVAYLYLGLENQIAQLDDNFNFGELNTVVRQLNVEAGQGTISLDGRFVLLDPDEDENYDWTTDPYPFPNEQINALINSVTARELNIFIRQKSDDIGNKFSNEDPNPKTEEF